MVCLILGWGLWHSGAKIPHMLPSQPGTEVSANSNRSAVPPRHAFILLPLLYISIFPKLQVCCVGIQQVDLVTLIDAPVRRGSHATETDESDFHECLIRVCGTPADLAAVSSCGS